MKYGSVIDIITIPIIISDNKREAFLTILAFCVLLSINELYHEPPSRKVIGRALNIPTLKLINHIQNNMFAIIGKDDPSIFDSYFGAIKSEYGTRSIPWPSVGGASNAIGFEVNQLLYLCNTKEGLGVISVIAIPRIPLFEANGGRLIERVIFWPVLSCHVIGIL